MKSRYVLFSIVGALTALTLTACTKGCKKSEETQAPTTETAPQTQAPTEKVTAEDTKPGTGEDAVAGSEITVHYTGTLKDGTKFDSSKDRNEPFKFTLGKGSVIKGWEIGIGGDAAMGITAMKKGGVRKLTIPASFGYGAQAVGAIPANSELFFEVELIDVKPAPAM